MNVKEKLKWLELIKEAKTKFPKARMIAVENFTMSCGEDCLAVRMNLEMDAGLYKWNNDTVNAIGYVLDYMSKPVYL